MNTAAELENARALHRLGRHKAAAEICQRILDRQPNQADALLILGAIADALGNSHASLGFLMRIVDRDPSYPGAAVLLADVLTKLGAADGAVAWYQAALAMDRDAERAVPPLARALAAAGKLGELAKLTEEQLAKARPELALVAARAGGPGARSHAGVMRALGLSLIATGEPSLAASPLRSATAAQPGDAEALAAFAHALGRDARWLVRALAVRPSSEGRVALGEAFARDGKVAAASAAFDAVLAMDAKHGAALRGLARLRLRLGEVEAAISLARRRLGDDPEDAEAGALLGVALARRGLAASAITFAQSATKACRREVARAIAEGVLTVAPDCYDAWRMIGTARGFRIALVHEPANAAAMVGFAEGDDDRALTWLERAIRFDGQPPTVLALARALIGTGAKDAALELLRPLLATIERQRSPMVVEFAGLLVDVGEAETAGRFLQAIATNDPSDANVAHQLIRALVAHGDAAALTRVGQNYLVKDEPRFAADAFAAARKIKPDNGQLSFLHGRALWDNDEKTAAIDAFVDAAEAAGDDNLDLMTRAGEALIALQATDLGLRYLGRSVERDFDNPSRHIYPYVFNFLNQCDWPARRAYVERLTRLGETKIARDDPDFRLNPSVWVFLAAERDLMYRSANHFARHHFPQVPRPPAAPRDADPERRIRLGYMSAFLQAHHIGYSLTGVLQGHDRSQVEIYLYGLTRDDAVQAGLKREAHSFRSIDDKSPAAIARMIASDGIDVLVDLDGYVNSASGLLTLEIASERPAPIQMLYHNYVGPTGTSFVDYVVADRELLDAHDDAGYRERLIRLPPCYYPAAPLPKAEIVTNRQSWGLPEHGAVFCNFGHFYKIEPTCFDVWMRILKQVPGSVLWMNHWDTPQAVANMQREAEARGVDPSRLVFSSLAEKPTHMARLALADLFLDTFVYASGVTSLDALWGGVPVLTVRGSTFARRVGASLNAGIGLEELTCESPEAFERMAVALATDRHRLQGLKARLRQNLRTWPLFDQARLAGNLEKAYRVAFRRYVAGMPPESFEIRA
ncbi:MAG: tetratricopeptide repeat protein [Alphaproteobacteria bacterium]|nr:tetratricopeptide repeat protein [Alphaproteobacteria bacterium]